MQELTIPRLQQQSIQSLRIEMRFGEQKLSTGTAFIVKLGVRRPLLITNRHNVTGRHQETGELLSKSAGVPDNIVVAHHVRNELGHWNGIRTPLLDAHGTPLWIEHPTWGEKADFVALPIHSTQGIDLYPYDLEATGPDIFLGPSEIISVIGFPFDLQINGFVAVWATGFIASEPEFDVGNLPVFLIDCRTRAGQSGSPVIAYRNGMAMSSQGASVMYSNPVSKFLGIYSGRIRADSDLGMVWKASAVIELVKSVRVDFSAKWL